MKLAIIGSRTIKDYSYLGVIIYDFFYSVESGFKFSEIVSGGAGGMDFLAKDFAQKNNIKYKEFPAAWYDLSQTPCKIKKDRNGRDYNVLAGYNRNSLIIDYANAVLAITTGSSGTEDSISKARKAKKPVFIFTV